MPRVARPSSARGQGSEGATSVDVGWVRRAALAQRAACTLIGRVWHRCSSAEGTASADGAGAMASSSGGPSSDGSSPPSSCRSSSLRAPASASLPTLAAADGSARLAARVQGRPSATPSSAVATSAGDHRSTRRHRRAAGAWASSARCASPQGVGRPRLRTAAAQRSARPTARGADHHDPSLASHRWRVRRRRLRPPTRGRVRCPSFAGDAAGAGGVRSDMYM